MTQEKIAQEKIAQEKTWNYFPGPICSRDITCRECFEIESKIQRMPGDIFVCPSYGKKSNKGTDYETAFKLLFEALGLDGSIACERCPARSACSGDKRKCKGTIKGVILYKCEIVKEKS